MLRMTVSELKSNFSKALKRVIAGEEIEILYGRKKEPVAKVLPHTNRKTTKRTLGRLEGKVNLEFMPDYKMGEDQLIDLKD